MYESLFRYKDTIRIKVYTTNINIIRIEQRTHIYEEVV